ncbi:cell division protein ZapA [Polynucleobacter sp.]|uniref:cell division protein ZapA n=1 Tax=Polynucleobacter sp. TaxID=2029855 RepID=UPI002588E1F2|nr:cell division protein ZapA [Polynucleobacter sp.]MCX7237332.1 cell division protein ZapA [Polynucleobacter sp.]
MSQQRIEVSLAGQKITLATSAEHEPLLRAACVLVDEQIQLAISGGNRSIERASMMAALKIAGDLITLQKNQTQQSTSSNVSSDEITRPQCQLRLGHSLSLLMHPKQSSRSTLNLRVQDDGLAAKAGNSCY